MKPLKKGRPRLLTKNMSKLPAALMVYWITAFWTTPVMTQPITKAQKVPQGVTAWRLK